MQAYKSHWKRGGIQPIPEGSTVNSTQGRPLNNATANYQPNLDVNYKTNNSNR